MLISTITDKDPLLENKTLKQSLATDILTESCQHLTASQRRIVEGIYKDLQPLIEASLTQQQIGQLFTGVEKASTAAGSNRTLIGKGVDTAKTVDQTINKVGQWLQNTTPVKAFDQSFENLKNNIASKFPQLDQSVSKLGEWAKSNPGKTSAIIGVLTTIAALGAGPVGGAIAGQILRGTAELLKGEKLSTAVGKGLKTAAYGALTGYTISKIGDLIGNGARVVADNIFPGAQRIELTFNAVGRGPGGGTWQDVTAVGRADDIATLKNTWNGAVKAWDSGNYAQAQNLFDQARSIGKGLADPNYVAALTSDRELAKTVLTQAKNLVAATDAVAAGAQGAIQSQGMNQKAATAESFTNKRPQEVNQQKEIRKIRPLPLRTIVDRDMTLLGWQLNESLDRQRGGLQFNRHGIDHVFCLIEQQLAELDVKGARAQDVLARQGKISQRIPAQAAGVPRATQTTTAANPAPAGQRIEPTVAPTTPATPRATPATPQAASAPVQPGATVQQPTAQVQQPAKPGLMSRIGQGLQTFGRQLTTKVTAEKLNTNWKAAGSPTDSDKLFGFLIKQGVPDAVARQVYGELNLQAPPTAATSATPAASATGTDSASAPSATARSAPSATAASATPTASAPSATATSATPTASAPSATARSAPSATAASATPTASAPSATAASDSELDKKSVRDIRTTDELIKRFGPGAGTSTATTGAGTATSGDSSQPGKMTPDDIVGQIKPIWDKITANQDNPIGAPAVKQLIKSMWMQSGGTKVAESRRKNKKQVDENVRWAIDHVRRRQKMLSGQRQS